MRESKYRAKVSDFEIPINTGIKVGDWAYGHYLEQEIQIDDGIWRTESFIYLTKYDHMVRVSVDPETVGEFAGLSYSGLDIYEGDVLKMYGGEPYDNGVVGMDYNWEFFGTVVFQDGSFVVQEFRDKCCIWIDAIFCEDIDVEKLGNIHDNPELLEV